MVLLLLILLIIILCLQCRGSVRSWPRPGPDPGVEVDRDSKQSQAESSQTTNQQVSADLVVFKINRLQFSVLGCSFKDCWRLRFKFCHLIQLIDFSYIWLDNLYVHFNILLPDVVQPISKFQLKRNSIVSCCFGAQFTEIQGLQYFIQDYIVWLMDWW